MILFFAHIRGQPVDWCGQASGSFSTDLWHLRLGKTSRKRLRVRDGAAEGPFGVVMMSWHPHPPRNSGNWVVHENQSGGGCVRCCTCLSLLCECLVVLLQVKFLISFFGSCLVHPNMQVCCFSALQCVLSKFSCLAQRFSTSTQKVDRKELWKEAQRVAQLHLRLWMQQHPGEVIPNEVFHECQRDIEFIVPLGNTKESLLSFVRYVHLDLMRVEGPPRKLRSEEEWQRLFPRYPSLENGFLQSFDATDDRGIRQFLEKYGFCVVKVLTRDECEKSILAMFEEINQLRIKKGLDGPQIDAEDPSTWSDRNWPSSCKFLVDSVALHPQAFANRCSRKIYEVFSSIFQESRLHVSVDKWGVARGAKDKPRWRIGLKPHWDVNPWQCVRDFESGNNPGYQGMVALRDQDLETGCHLTLPGCTHFLKQWTLERRLEKVSKSKKSFRAEEDDPLLRYMHLCHCNKGRWLFGHAHNCMVLHITTATGCD